MNPAALPSSESEFSFWRRARKPSSCETLPWKPPAPGGGGVSSKAGSSTPRDPSNDHRKKVVFDGFYKSKHGINTSKVPNKVVTWLVSRIWTGIKTLDCMHGILGGGHHAYPQKPQGDTRNSKKGCKTSKQTCWPVGLAVYLDLRLSLPVGLLDWVESPRLK